MTEELKLVTSRSGEVDPRSLGLEGVRLAHFIEHWAARSAERVCTTLWRQGEVVDQISYGSLLRESGRVADLCVRERLEPGAFVVVVAHASREFFAAFAGIQRAGCVPVPFPPPDPLESFELVLARLTEFVSGCRARAVYLPQALAREDEVRHHLEQRGVRLYRSGDADGAAQGPARACELFYCQFTSGSSGRSKGVLLTHDNVMASLRGRMESLAFSEREVGVTWLPMAHNMGLHSWLICIVAGAPFHIMPRYDFATRPASWLRLISQVGGTISTASNHSFALCARSVKDEELAGVDLASWRIATCGGEVVTREACDAFSRRFARWGFRREALIPAYGCAEDVLTTTTRRPGEGPRFDRVARGVLSREGRAEPTEREPSLWIASLGRALPGQEVMVLADDGGALPERVVGEIAVRGGTVMQGYTRDTSGELVLRSDGVLLTGDLGYLADHELFVVGRKKELIIKAGRNYYPQDVEEACAAVPGLRAGRIAAFGVPGADMERLVIAAEITPEASGEQEAMAREIRASVMLRAGIGVDEVVLLPMDALPVTPSGKLRRSEARARHLAGALAQAPGAAHGEAATRPPKPSFWEDFVVGQTLELGVWEVKRDEIVEFARRYDPQPFHVDEEAAKTTPFGGLIASGWHTCAMLMRLMHDNLLFQAAGLGSPGMDSIRWLKPVRPGDTLTASGLVCDKRLSASKPDRGLVRNRWQMTNQRGELVMTLESNGLYRKRSPVSAPLSLAAMSQGRAS